MQLNHATVIFSYTYCIVPYLVSDNWSKVKLFHQVTPFSFIRKRILVIANLFCLCSRLLTRHEYIFLTSYKLIGDNKKGFLVCRCHDQW